MAKEDCIDFEGTVVEAIPGAQFKVQVELPSKQDSNENENSEPKYHYILATLAGKLRVNGIKILVGDRVRVETSFYDLTRGRITWRFKGGKDQFNNEQINSQINDINLNNQKNYN